MIHGLSDHGRISLNDGFVFFDRVLHAPQSRAISVMEFPVHNNIYRTHAIISRGFYIFYLIYFSVVYNQERLVLETIYVLNEEI